MMRSFAVLEPTYSENPAREAKLVSDHWRFLAFLVPTLWLLYYRLWLPFLGWVAISLAIVLLPATWAFAAFTLTGLVRYWIALEGPRWYIAKLERNGWWLSQVIEASDLDDAEWQFAQSENADNEAKIETPPRPIRAPVFNKPEAFDLLDMSVPQKA